jgi:membrane protein required for colicin V production
VNTYDLICLILLCFSAWKGYKKGLIREMAGLLGLFFAVWIAWKWMGQTGFFLDPFLPGQAKSVLPFLGFATVFSVCIIAFTFFARFATKLLDITILLGLLNRLAGAAVGILQSGLLIVLFTWITNHAGLLSDELKSKSDIYPITSKAGPFLYSATEKYFPKSDSLFEYVQTYLREGEHP